MPDSSGYGYGKTFTPLTVVFAEGMDTHILRQDYMTLCEQMALFASIYQSGDITCSTCIRIHNKGSK